MSLCSTNRRKRKIKKLLLFRITPRSTLLLSNKKGPKIKIIPKIINPTKMAKRKIKSMFLKIISAIRKKSRLENQTNLHKPRLRKKQSKGMIKMSKLRENNKSVVGKVVLVLAV